MSDSLLDSIRNRGARIGVIGLGYVGLPLSLECVRAGFAVTGFDLDKAKINHISDGLSYIKHIPGEKIHEAVSTKRFSATNDFSLLAEMSCIIVCVPTPLNRYREPDMSFVFDTTRTIAGYLRKGQLIVLESSTYPGTTDQDMRAILEETGLKAGIDFHLAYSPEREDPGNRDFSTGTIPKIVGGFTPDCLKVASAFYDSVIVRTVPVSSTRAAEATKLYENIFRAVNIAMANEMKMLFDKMDIDIWEVIEAAKTKPFGFMPFYPGPGLGGHCIPIDPFYLTWKAREFDFSTRFIELAGEINTAMPYYVVQKTIDALNIHDKNIKGARLLILGLSYKKDIDDTRESPSFKLMELIESRGASVDYNDPYLPATPKKRDYEYTKKSVELTAENLSGYDCVIISTNHSSYDIPFILSNSSLIVDTRNATNGLLSDKIVKA